MPKSISFFYEIINLSNWGRSYLGPMYQKAPLILYLFCFLSYSGKAQNDVTQDLKKLEIFLSNIDSKYVDSVNTYSLVEEALKKMLRELDPHSVYLDKENYQSTTEQLNGKFKGIGIRYQMIDDTLTILEVLDGSGAQKAGLKLGDQLIAAGNDTLSGKSLSKNDISEILDANAESNEGITVWGSSSKERSLKYIIRSNIMVSSVPAFFMIDKKTGYIKLSKFTDNSYDDVKLALDQLTKNGAKQLIFDLRGNTGGYLNRAIKIVDEFLEDRKLIVYTEGQHQPKRETFATNGGKFTDGDLILLLDENSASASEIVAGAIQDWDRGLIIGRRSFGKGLVQRPIEFEDGSAMRLTISRYYTPTGRSIQQPYDEGYDAYKNEHKSRESTGELMARDSIKVLDSLVYLTPKNRRLYAGGGILPDLFVPADTTTYSKDVDLILKKGLYYGYVLHYLKQNSQVLLEIHESANDFVNRFEVEEAMIQDFNHYLSQRGMVSFSIENPRNIEQTKRQLKSLIARFAFDYNAYFRVLIEYDEDVITARDAFEKDTMQELGLK
jgi:carboxyl-terminal processing protease